jgi:hypothetical protein
MRCWHYSNTKAAYSLHFQKTSEWCIVQNHNVVFNLVTLILRIPYSAFNRSKYQGFSDNYKKKNMCRYCIASNMFLKSTKWVYTNETGNRLKKHNSKEVQYSRGVQHFQPMAHIEKHSLWGQFEFSAPNGINCNYIIYNYFAMQLN